MVYSTPKGHTARLCIEGEGRTGDLEALPLLRSNDGMPRASLISYKLENTKHKRGKQGTGREKWSHSRGQLSRFSERRLHVWGSLALHPLVTDNILIRDGCL